MVYIDTSALVALLTNEDAASRVSEWLRRQAVGSMHISGRTIAEFSSALALKMRTGQLNPQQRQIARESFDRLVTRSLTILPVTDDDCLAAARYCEHYDLGLRAADSLHLAISIRAGLLLATLDVTLARACMAFSAPSQLI